MKAKVLYLKEELNKKSLLEYPITLENRIINKRKRIEEVEENEQVSIVSDSMFKTMLNNEKRIEFPCKLLSNLLDISYEELLESLTLSKNEFDKDSIESKGERGEFLAKVGENYISIEMNIRNTLDRNIEYLDRVHRSKVKVGSSYIYPATIQINLNNFSFEEHDKAMEVYKLQNEKGETLTRKMYIQIYLPILMKKRYNKEETLSELEKSILVMIETDREKVKELATGDKILERYMEEAKMVEKNDNYLREAYDHEQAIIDTAKELGFEEGMKQGLKNGVKQTQKKMIEKMLKKGMMLEEIQNIFDFDNDEIRKIMKEENK